MAKNQAGGMARVHHRPTTWVVALSMEQGEVLHGVTRWPPVSDV